MDNNSSNQKLKKWQVGNFQGWGVCGGAVDVNNNKKCRLNSHNSVQYDRSTSSFKRNIPIKMSLALEYNKKLRSIGVRPAISHRKDTRSIMF